MKGRGWHGGGDGGGGGCGEGGGGGEGDEAGVIMTVDDSKGEREIVTRSLSSSRLRETGEW